MRVLDVDPGSDRFEFSDPFAKVGDFDPAGGWGQDTVAALLGQFEPLEVEPAIPRLEPGPTSAADTADDLRQIGQRAVEQRVMVPSLVLPQRLDFARQFVIGGAKMMIDGHQPAIVDVEVFTHRLDRRLARRNVGHALEIALAWLADRGLLFLDCEIDSDRGVDHQRQFEADENRRCDEPDSDERWIDPNDPAQGRANPG